MTQIIEAESAKHEKKKMTSPLLMKLKLRGQKIRYNRPLILNLKLILKSFNQEFVNKLTESCSRLNVSSWIRI